ncbi:MAG: tyrosine-type recombinase/integrase [Bdellovibrionales bacterium]
MKHNIAVKIHKLTSGQFQTSYENPITKKRKRHKFAELKLAENFKADLERKFYSGNMNHFSEEYVGRLIERHLKECPESRLMERMNVFQSFCDEFSGFKQKDLTKSELKHWFEKIREKQDYSERTLATIKSQINYFFKFLVEEGLLNQSPLDQIKFKRNPPPRRTRVILSIDEVRTILSNAKAFSPDLLYPFLACIAHTGARREEVMRLNRGDIDFQTGLIHLKVTKNGRERFVRMSPTIEGILRAQLYSHDHKPVFTNKEGQAIVTNKTFGRLMNKFKAFFPMDKSDWGCHSLRHSFAYNFLKKGGEMYQLQAVLGHRSIDVTVDLYGQLQAQDISNPSPYEP